jgi:hypothetical protein
MIRSIYLDRKKTAPLEPSEGDERNGSWISSFDVPQSIKIWGERESFSTIWFDYLGGETGDDRRPLDDQEDPSIQVRAGRHTGKILELNFGRSISQSDLPSIGERIAIQAELNRPLATKFNYLMISSIICHWVEVVEIED